MDDLLSGGICVGIQVRQLQTDSEGEMFPEKDRLDFWLRQGAQGVTIFVRPFVRPFVPNLSRALILHILASDSS